MFRKVRKQLILYNSVTIAVFLVIFVIVSFIGVIWGVYHEEQKEILVYAEEEAEENVLIVQHKLYLKSDFLKEENQEAGIVFYCVTDNQSQLLYSSKPQSIFCQELIQTIKKWKAASNKPFLTTFKNNTRKVMGMMISHPLQNGGKVYGTIYVGKDVTPYYKILKKLLGILSGFLIMFLIFVTFAGYTMAGRAMEPIKRAYERQREFLADASHELRTPLSVLLSSVDAVQGDDGNHMTPFTEQVLVDMRDEIKKMSRIVRDLLTLARADTSHLNLMKEQFDIKPVSEQIIRTLNPIAQTKNIHLKADIMEDVMIYADRERITQLLLILLDNAIKYTLIGGTVELVIHLSKSDPGELKIMVRDNGIGISPSEQGRIFERFYRVDKTRSREMGGTGLGLAIAKWIAEIHGGSIKVISQPDQGSDFIVTLPQ